MFVIAFQQELAAGCPPVEASRATPSWALDPGRETPGLAEVGVRAAFTCPGR